MMRQIGESHVEVMRQSVSVALLQFTGLFARSAQHKQILSLRGTNLSCLSCILHVCVRRVIINVMFVETDLALKTILNDIQIL